MTAKSTSPDRDLARVILSVSAGMIGVCATLIGLVKVVEGRIGPSRVDEFGALAALIFLVSVIAGYLAIRHASRKRFSRACEALADGCFVIGLAALTLIALLFGYEII